MAEKHNEGTTQHVPRTGRPETAEPPYLGNYVPQPLENELFPEEWAALQELKQDEISHYFHDRFLSAFLLARKLDIKRTRKLLKSNLKWRKDNGYEKIPSFDSLNKDVILSNFGYKIPGARDKNGCGLLFCKMGNMLPDNFKNFDSELTNWVIWNNAEGNLWEDMDFHRNGLTFVFDLSDIGWKNVDLGLQRRINATLMDNFPMRVTKILVVNPPMIFKSLLAAARLIIKKKVMDRLQILENLDQIKAHVDENVLPVAFGGKNPWQMKDYMHFVEKARMAYPLEAPPLTLTSQTKLASHKKFKKTTSAQSIDIKQETSPRNDSLSNSTKKSSAGGQGLLDVSRDKKKTDARQSSLSDLKSHHHHHHHRDSKSENGSDKSVDSNSTH